MSFKVLFVSAECSPFAKTGGLADFAGSLPVYLKKLGLDVNIVIPRYSLIEIESNHLEIAIKKMDVCIGNEHIECKVYKSFLEENTPVYFIDYDPFFGRPNLYHDEYFNDYQDNPKRYAAFSKAALQLCHELNFKPDIVHVNDWHTSLIPAYLKKRYSEDPLFCDIANVLTIHNLAYQGRYSSYFYEYTGLDPEDFTWQKFECHYAVNFLKGGIFYADRVNTVSPGYALETLTQPGGFGLDYFLRLKGDRYSGILNGVDYNQWNPETDSLLPANYSSRNLKGKIICKKTLQQKFNLKIDSTIPLIGIVSRLVEQKGFYLLSACFEKMLTDFNAQFIILGAGEYGLEQYFHNLSEKCPDKLGSCIGYNNELAHLIEAGSDFFLMPSLYEPCGLNQIYSMKYGTLPIVRATGGLNDTVQNFDPDNNSGTGFKFHEPDPEAIYNTVKWALDLWHNKPIMNKLIKNAMGQNFSWEKSAKEYLKLYTNAIK